jgi:hypothetical protein
VQTNTNIFYMMHQMADMDKKSESIEYTDFYRCRNCGDFFDKKDAVKEVFCSNFCASKYTACENCGKFFIKVLKTDDNYCSNGCRIQYDERIKEIEADNHAKGDIV